MCIYLRVLSYLHDHPLPSPHRRYGVWWTMTPASVIVGVCAAPLWAAQCAYFTLEAQRLGALTDEQPDDVLSRFFGIFFCFFQLSAYSRGLFIRARFLRTFCRGLVVPFLRRTGACVFGDSVGHKGSNLLGCVHPHHMYIEVRHGYGGCF